MMDYSQLPKKTHYDCVIIGSGHNGLVAAAYLAKAGQSVLVLERNDYIGGATASQKVFPDYDAWLSRYSYLIALLSPKIINELDISFETRRRRIASFTAYRDSTGNDRGLLLSNVDSDHSRQSMLEMCGSSQAWDKYQHLMALEQAIASIAWPTLTSKLQSRRYFEKQLADPLSKEAWNAFVERPVGEVIEKYAEHDALRGLLLTDAKIGVFSHAHDPSLLQNRCFLYHVIGNGTGEWRVPVGGMRALVDALVRQGCKSGVEYCTQSPASHIEIGSPHHTITFEFEGTTRAISATRVLVNATPKVYHQLLKQSYSPRPADEGSVMKVNMLLRRLPKLKCGIRSEDAFAGSFHIDEGYAQFAQSYQQAAEGQIPTQPPAEIYCHTLTDPSILSNDLQTAGYHTLTLFGLDIPYRLFEKDHDLRKEEIKRRYLQGLNRLCDEPFEDCLATDHQGQPCIEIKSPIDLENDVGLDLGNIFHNELTWFFTDDPQKENRWGVETDHPRIYLAGSSADRGGAVSGIPGHNAAQCIFEELGIRN
jgi:phytoene dehydrogenase-like protein